MNIFKPLQEMRELSLLQELEIHPIVSQRELSQRFGMALGVTNSCLKKMIQKGLIRMKGLDHHRIGYYLTQRGVTEKTRLDLNLIFWTVQHYTVLKNIIREKLLEMQHVGIKRIVFYGVSDEMEVAFITLQDTSLKLVGIVEDDEKYVPRILFGYELEPVSRVRELRPESILITSLTGREGKRERLQKIVDMKKVYVSDI